MAEAVEELKLLGDDSYSPGVVSCLSWLVGLSLLLFNVSLLLMLLFQVFSFIFVFGILLFIFLFLFIYLFYFASSSFHSPPGVHHGGSAGEAGRRGGSL